MKKTSYENITWSFCRGERICIVSSMEKPTTTNHLAEKFVGARGFEPPTPCSQSKCASRTALRPETYQARRV